MAVDDQAGEIVRQAAEEVVANEVERYFKVGGAKPGANGTIPPIPVTTSPQPLGTLVFEQALTSGSSPDMNIDGSVTPVSFTIDPDATLEKVIEELTFKVFDGGIKNDNFLGLNTALTTGIAIDIQSEENISSFLKILDTIDFDEHFALGPGGRFQILFASGRDSLVAKFSPTNPFILKPVGTFDTDDSVKVTINDNLSSVTFLGMTAFGFLR